MAKTYKKILALSIRLSVISVMAVAIISCSGGTMDTTNKVSFPSIKDVPAEAWQKLAQKKIYFGHQSVGYNIIDGIKDVMQQNPQIKLNIVETINPADFDSPLFAHSPVGQNRNPKSKCDVFTAFMNAGIGGKTDFAFLKFCYVDILHGTDVSKVFETYKSTIVTLQSKYPKLILVHLTTPLTTIQTGLKASIKNFLGRPIGGYDDNVKREQFNALLRKEYSGKEPIFDLAGIESTSQDGSRVTFEKDGKAYPALAPAYTNDGGHLNELGRKVVAEQFLIFLANLAIK